jgi:hypothetical protein
MTSDEFRQLRQLILEQNVRFEAVRLEILGKLREAEDLNRERHRILVEYLASDELMEAIESGEVQNMDIPDDIKALLAGYASRGGPGDPERGE